MVIPRRRTAGRKRGASVTTILHSGASARGVVDASGRVFFGDRPSAFATIAHDAHGVSVITASGRVASGGVPGSD
jgi:hypothetical protein